MSNFSVLGQTSEPRNQKHIVISMSLLMRMFEWCHEEAKDDVAMHKAMENIVAFNDGVNPLTIDTYDSIIAQSETKESEEDEEDEEGVDTSYELGQTMADNGFDLSDTNFSDVGQYITGMKGGEGGASNEDLQDFWDGYNADGMEITLCADDDCYKPCEGCETTTDDIPVDALEEIEKIITIAR